VTAVVFDIQRNSFQDGPGIRTTVFLKGCCMRCAWCHNPESFSPEPAVAVLPNGIRKEWGRSMSAEEVFAEVIKDKAFYQTSGGGVTVSGGEPLMFPEFCAELFGLCREVGIPTAVETNGFPDWRNFGKILHVTDFFLFDYKCTDPDAHKVWTGTSLKPMLENLDSLAQSGKKIMLRCPIIPGVNDNEAHYKGIADLVVRYGFPVQVMAYHATAIDKWKALGYPYKLEGVESMTSLQARDVVSRICAAGCPADKISLP
jgi:pyruvate formate lyase activating enzyme